jgi:hypothetical protein
MNFVDAAAAVSDELAVGTPGQPARAALQLAVMAWQGLGDDTAWDRFGLEVLAVSEFLTVLPDTVLVCDPPHPGDPHARLALTHLVSTLAAQFEAAAGDDGQALADRLAYDAAANRLRRAIGWLP